MLRFTIDNGTKLRFHDLRHVFATWLHKAGVSLDELRFLLGHKDFFSSRCLVERQDQPFRGLYNLYSLGRLPS